MKRRKLLKMVSGSIAYAALKSQQAQASAAVFVPDLQQSTMSALWGASQQIVKVSYSADGKVVGSDKPANKSIGYCARGSVYILNRSLKAAGIDKTVQSANAGDMAPNLAKAGFQEYDSPPPEGLRNGDAVLIIPTNTAHDTINGKLCQHMAVWVQTSPDPEQGRWVCDFNQRQGVTDPSPYNFDPQKFPQDFRVAYFRNQQLADASDAVLKNTNDLPQVVDDAAKAAKQPILGADLAQLNAATDYAATVDAVNANNPWAEACPGFGPARRNWVKHHPGGHCL